MYEVYRVRRSFQWNVWQFAPPGRCACSLVQGSTELSTRVVNGVATEGMYDKNPCQDTGECTGMNATACGCGDNGYCGYSGGGGACGIKPHNYGGDIWIVNAGDPRKEYVITRRRVIYDPSLPDVDQLIKEERYKVLVEGEPTPDKVWFPAQGDKIIAPDKELVTS